MKAPKEEEEEPVKGKRKPLIRVGDEDEDKQDAAAASDLEREAQKAKNPAVRSLLQSLKKPHDVVTTKEGRVFVVEPIAKYITPETQFKGLLTLRVFSDDWRRGGEYKVGRLGLVAVDPYEHIVLTKVNDFLASGLERETGTKRLSRTEMLQAAEKALAAVIRFHESARLR